MPPAQTAANMPSAPSTFYAAPTQANPTQFLEETPRWAGPHAGSGEKPDTCICETPSYAECTEPSTPTARECCGAQQMLPHANPEESRTINHNPLFGTSHSYWGRLSAFFEPPTFQVRVLPGAQHIPLPETTLTGLRIPQLSLSTTIPLSPSRSTLPNPANSSRFYSASACPSLWA